MAIDLRLLGALVGLVVSIVLARRVWALVRSMLDAGVKIPLSSRLWGSWFYLWLLVPLAFGTSYRSHGIADDGAAIKTVIEYGGGGASYSILFSAIAIMLFQLLVRLESFNPQTS